jgi:ELWxxDGT repeat protein
LRLNLGTILLVLFLIFCSTAHADTELIKDIRPGAASSSPDNFLNINGTLFFAADDGTNGIELWTSNGTAAGTVLVEDINSGAANSSPSNLTNVNGTLFFAADDGTNGIELWKSNGTSGGTVIVKDINPGAANSSPSKLTNIDGILLFAATDGVNGIEIWKSEIPEETVIVTGDGCFINTLTLHSRWESLL